MDLVYASWDLLRQPRGFNTLCMNLGISRRIYKRKTNCAICDTGEFHSFPLRFAHVCLLRLNLSGFLYVCLFVARRNPLDRSREPNVRPRGMKLKPYPYPSKKKARNSECLKGDSSTLRD